MAAHEDLRSLLEISDEEDETARGIRRRRNVSVDNCETLQLSNGQKTAGSGMPKVLTPRREQVIQKCDPHIPQMYADDKDERAVSVSTHSELQMRGMERRYDLGATPVATGYGPAWTRYVPERHTGIQNGAETCDYDPEHPHMQYMPRNADSFLEAQGRLCDNAKIYDRGGYGGGYLHKASRVHEWVDHYDARGHEYRPFHDEERVAEKTRKYKGAAYNDQYFQDRDRLEYPVRNQGFGTYEEPPYHSEYAPRNYRPGARRDARCDDFDFCEKMRWEDHTRRTDRHQDYRERRGYVLASEQWA
jgi:hypothetical protein